MGSDFVKKLLMGATIFFSLSSAEELGHKLNREVMKQLPQPLREHLVPPPAVFPWPTPHVPSSADGVTFPQIQPSIFWGIGKCPYQCQFVDENLDCVVDNLCLTGLLKQEDSSTILTTPPQRTIIVEGAHSCSGECQYRDLHGGCKIDVICLDGGPVPHMIDDSPDIKPVISESCSGECQYRNHNGDCSFNDLCLISGRRYSIGSRFLRKQGFVGGLERCTEVCHYSDRQGDCRLDVHCLVFLDQRLVSDDTLLSLTSTPTTMTSTQAPTTVSPNDKQTTNLNWYPDSDTESFDSSSEVQPTDVTPTEAFNTRGSAAIENGENNAAFISPGSAAIGNGENNAAFIMRGFAEVGTGQKNASLNMRGPTEKMISSFIERGSTEVGNGEKSEAFISQASAGEKSVAFISQGSEEVGTGEKPVTFIKREYAEVGTGEASFPAAKGRVITSQMGPIEVHNTNSKLMPTYGNLLMLVLIAFLVNIQPVR